MKYRKKPPREKECPTSSATQEETEWDQQWKYRLKQAVLPRMRQRTEKGSASQRDGNEGKEGKIKDPAETREKDI